MRRVWLLLFLIVGGCSGPSIRVTVLGLTRDGQEKEVVTLSGSDAHQVWQRAERLSASQGLLKMPYQYRVKAVVDGESHQIDLYRSPLVD